MENYTKWTEIPRMNIQSDRDAKVGEKICAFVINPATDEILENNLFIPDSDEINHYIWPKKFAEKINKTSSYICAGEMNENGNIEPLNSQYRNKLWKSNAKLTVYPTNCCLNCWKEGGGISSSGAIPPGMRIILSTKSKNYNLLYETLTFSSDSTTSTMYQWPYHLSVYINKNSLFLRSGEKNQETKLITPLKSSYRNKIWLPNGSNYTYDMKYEANDVLKSDAEKVFNNALATLTGVQPPSKTTVDQWLIGFSQGRFRDISYPSTNAGSNTAPLYKHLGRTRDIANYIYHNSVSEEDNLLYFCHRGTSFLYQSRL
ncbi:hypothetical protein [Xenorhabdus sp. PB62.4]|uniref:hypothetical protein n=1 Tax=Xenorhabdus sp. PB62.4 TaxID=1851573 RepID=UPI001656A0A2|nr:hypothetical protein [Xenorhabdus sp. PB62.4]MBC8954983.1 carbohydrate-binding protein [Xenorhabdus sp. PB62.4]